MIQNEYKNCSRENVIFSLKNNRVPMVRVSNRFATAEVALLGAHVLSFIPNGKDDLLWLSEKSNFEIGKPIRGGIPVCWPWFGPAKEPSHGVARIHLWKLTDVKDEQDGSTTLTLSLPQEVSRGLGLKAEMTIRIGAALTVALTTENVSSQDQPLSGALHSYFAVKDINRVRISGLDGQEFIDNLTQTRAPYQGEIRFDSEFDRVFDSFSGTVVIHDDAKKRSIKVEKSGSNSTVVWNPWTAKSKRLEDFGDEEFHTMCCVESANAKNDARILKPGEKQTLSSTISLL